MWGGKQTGIVNVAFGVDAGTEWVLLEVSGSTPHLANSNAPGAQESCAVPRSMFWTWSLRLNWTHANTAGLINSVCVRLMAGRRGVESWTALTPMLVIMEKSIRGRWNMHASCQRAMFATHVVGMQPKTLSRRVEAARCGLHRTSLPRGCISGSLVVGQGWRL